jgi:hypothetical protein
MTIAFVVQTFKDIDQISRLARTLARGTTDRLVVVSHRGGEGDFKRLRSVDAIDGVLHSPGGRGCFGIIDGLIASMRWLEKQPKSYDWFVVLSGQDYPIRPLHELESELAGSQYDGHFHYFDTNDHVAAASAPMYWTKEEIEHRYHFRYSTIREESTKLERALFKVPRHILDLTPNWRLHTSFGIKIGARPAKTPFTDEFKLYGGSYWAVISRKAVRAVLEFVDERPDIVDYFRDVVDPEEAFLPTVLANDRSLRLSSRELRFYDFENSHLGHPLVIGTKDLDRVLASGCFIARKFDMRRDPEVLDDLDRRLLASSNSSMQAA